MSADEAKEERRLVRAAQGGDQGAFTTLAERYQGPLFRFLHLRLGSREDAEELLQEALLRAWSKLGLYDERWRFSTWLYTLASRLAVSRRRRASLPCVGPEPLEGCLHEADPAEAASRAEQRDNLWSLAAQVLSPDQRAALWLRYGEGLEPIEIARVLSKRASSVRVLLFRARERLAGHLQTNERTPAANPLTGSAGGSAAGALAQPQHP